MQNKKVKFNWRFPLYGAIGFWIGSFISHSGPLLLIPPIFQWAVMGGIGGASLGLAFRDKKKVLLLLIAGAIGGPLGILGGILLRRGAIGGATGFSLGAAGAILGASLGLVLKGQRKIFYLAGAGAIGSILGFIIRNISLKINPHTIINHGLILGIILGLTLAYLIKKERV